MIEPPKAAKSVPVPAPQTPAPKAAQPAPSTPPPQPQKRTHGRGPEQPSGPKAKAAPQAPQAGKRASDGDDEQEKKRRGTEADLPPMPTNDSEAAGVLGFQLSNMPSKAMMQWTYKQMSNKVHPDKRSTDEETKLKATH